MKREEILDKMTQFWFGMFPFEFPKDVGISEEDYNTVYSNMDKLLTNMEHWGTVPPIQHNVVWKINKKLVDHEDYDFEEHKLAHLLINGEIFCNNGWWFEKEGISWPKDHITFHVNCNDVFGWGCADSEDITYSEIGELYNMWRKDPRHGTAVWCIKKRKCWPQKPVEEAIRKAGIWDLDSMGLE